MELEYLGQYENWQLYRNSEGYIEGYLSTGKREFIDDRGGSVRQNIHRVVSLEKTPQSFLRYVKGFKKKTSFLDRIKATLCDKQPKLFSDEEGIC